MPPTMRNTLIIQVAIEFDVTYEEADRRVTIALERILANIYLKGK